MHQSSSSISSSERGAAFGSRGDFVKTSAWFFAALVVLELLCWVAFETPLLRESSLRAYLWYGESYESKLRTMATTPDLPERSVLHAGWLSPEVLKDEPTEVDVTVYGSSFAGNLATAMKIARPSLRVRSVGGPGAPMNHTYGMYLMDRPLRTTRIGIIGVVSETVVETLTMNAGTLFTDTAAPYCYPRFDLVDGHLRMTADAPIKSEAEFSRAILDPVLWEQKLDILSRHDDAYRRLLFAADPFDRSMLARVLRRALVRFHRESYEAKIYGRHGFEADAYAIKVFEALLFQMVSDLRAERVVPVVVLFSTRGFHNHLAELLAKPLDQAGVLWLNSFDVCPSTDPRSFQPDGHFTASCDRAIAGKVLALLSDQLGEEGR